MSVETSARSVRRTEGADPVRALQLVLYRTAKQDRTRRFHALYDHLARSEVMWRAWVAVATNRGAPGIDGVTIAGIEAGGVTGIRAFLDGLANELRTGTYRPQALRRVYIPKPGDPADHPSRPLSIPAVRDRVIMSAAKIVLEPISKPTSTQPASGSARSVPPTRPSKPSARRPTEDRSGHSTPTSRHALTRSGLTPSSLRSSGGWWTPG
jgi:RNA-directed DNA polymerase